MNLALLVALATLASTSAAQTSQVCYTDNVPLTSTNWIDSVTLPKFDPTLGTLVSIQCALTGNIQGSSAFESLDATGSTVLTNFSAEIKVTRPNGTLLVVSIPIASFTDVVTAFDGTIDFGGTSGLSRPGITATKTEIVTCPPPASDLTLFLGPGTITMPVEATALSSATGPGNIISQFLTQAAATVEICYSYIPNVPPSFSSCPTAINVSVGVPVSFQVCAQDTPDDTVTLTSSPLPPGATLTPPSGNPLCTTFNWTPTNADVGTYTLTFTATDTHTRSATCSLQLVVAECYQLLGRGGDGSSVQIGGTLFSTHLSSVNTIWPVTMSDRPSMRVPMITSGSIRFSVQTLMHNPDVFPSNPDQWTPRLRVFVQPGGVVSADLEGSSNSMGISLSTYTDPNGDLWMTFPFTIVGM